VFDDIVNDQRNTADSPNIFEFAPLNELPHSTSDDNSDSTLSLQFLNYEEEVESDVYFTDSDEDDGEEEEESVGNFLSKIPPPSLFSIEEEI